MIFLKIKLAYQKWKHGKDYDYMVKKNGHKIFAKEKQVWDEYLRVSKRNMQKVEEARLKGFLECIEWLREP